MVYEPPLRKGKLPLLIRDGVPDHDAASPTEEDTAVAGIQSAQAPAVGLRGAEGGRGNESGCAVAVEVADHPQHWGVAVELAEAAAEAGVGDEAAPAPADERGADEIRGLVRRQAEEYLLHELIQQRRRRQGTFARSGSGLRTRRRMLLWIGGNWGKSHKGSVWLRVKSRLQKKRMPAWSTK